MKKVNLLLIILALASILVAQGTEGLEFKMYGDPDIRGYEVSIGTLQRFQGDIVIPSQYQGENVVKIGRFSRGMFRSIEIPNSVKRIGSYAFMGCNNLTSVTIPSSVIRIEGTAFNDCLNLTSVTIPSSVTMIEASAFSSCPNLTIYAAVANKPSSWDHNWNSENRPVVWGTIINTDSNVVRFEGVSKEDLFRNSLNFFRGLQGFTIKKQDLNQGILEGEYRFIIQRQMRNNEMKAGFTFEARDGRYKIDNSEPILLNGERLTQEQIKLITDSAREELKRVADALKRSHSKNSSW